MANIFRIGILCILNVIRIGQVVSSVRQKIVAYFFLQTEYIWDFKTFYDTPELLLFYVTHRYTVMQCHVRYSTYLSSELITWCGK